MWPKRSVVMLQHLHQWQYGLGRVRPVAVHGGDYVSPRPLEAGLIRSAIAFSGLVHDHRPPLPGDAPGVIARTAVDDHDLVIETPAVKVRPQLVDDLANALRLV